MSKVYDKIIDIEMSHETTEEWYLMYTPHASINKSRANSEYFNGGASRSGQSLTFEVRYFPALKDIARNTQKYRIVYEGKTYNIVDYDDYMLQHKTVKLSGVSY